MVEYGHMESSILVINSGSSSLKFSLLDTATHQVIAKGIAEELKTPRANFTIKANDAKETDKLDDPSFEGAMQRLFDELEERGLEIIDLEYDVHAFQVRLPRLHIIDIDDFDPMSFL